MNDFQLRVCVLKVVSVITNVNNYKFVDNNND